MKRLLAMAVVTAVVVALASEALGVGSQRDTRVGGTPLAVVGSPSGLWILTCDRRCSGVARRSTGRVVFVDPRAGRIASSHVVTRPGAMAITRRKIYLTDFWADTVRALPRAHGVERRRLRLVLPFDVAPGDNAFLPSDVAAGRDAVWISTARGVLAHADPELTAVGRMIRFPVKTGAIAIGARSVWIAGGLSGVYRVSTRTARIAARIPVARETRRLSIDELITLEDKVFAVGSWTSGMSLTGERALVEIDARRNRVVRFRRLDRGRIAIAAGAGSLWLARVGSTTIRKIDVRTGTSQSFDVGREVGPFLAVSGSTLWTVTSDGRVARINDGSA